MNWRNKKNFPYYIGAFTFLISVLLVLISNDIAPFSSDQIAYDPSQIKKNPTALNEPTSFPKYIHDRKNGIMTIVGVTSAFIAFFTFLSAYDNRVRRIRNIFISKLHLQDDDAGRSFEKIHLLPAKKLLLQKVKESCEQILNIEFTTTVKKNEFKFKPDYIVKTNHHFYENFKNLKKKERSTATVESLDLRKKITGMVITGEPGNGKTFGLARWINDMVKVINEDLATKESLETKIPVFISLNGWMNAELTEELFEGWLVEAIMKQYHGLDSKIIKYLVQHHEIIPCADGLDEVAEEYRFGCLKSIVKYAGIKNSLAFSCRKVIFQDLLQRENFDVYSNISVFELQTLSEDKILSTIRGTKKDSHESIDFLLNNRALIKYISTPLFLNLYMLTFDALGEENKKKIKESADQEIFEHIMWKTYDDLMMNEKVLKNRLQSAYEIWPKRIRTYMVALSNNIQGNWFYIDQIQPAWLGKPYRIYLYYFTSRILSGLIVSIAVGFFIASAFSFISNGILASAVVALLTIWMNNSKEHKTLLHKIPAPFLFPLILLIVTGLYQGFSVPRRPDDLIFGKTFSVTESLSGIVLGLFFGIIFGLRKTRQDNRSDIQPVQLFFFNWKHSLLEGFKGGSGVGLFVGTCAVCINLFFEGGTFSGWLAQTIIKIIGTFNYNVNQSTLIIFTFSFGLLVGFIIGFILFAIMAGLDREKMDAELTKKLAADTESYLNTKSDKHVLNIGLNEGIKQSLINAVTYGLIAFAILTLIHGSLIFLYNLLAGSMIHPENFIRALLIGVGSGMIAFLWFGGFEVIQHYCLRIYLYLFGISPLQFNRWVQKIIDLAFMRKVGAGLQYYHPKLKDYFCDIPNQEEAPERLTDTTRRKTSLLLHVMMLVVTCAFLILPLYEVTHLYWNSKSRFIVFQCDDSIATKGLNEIIIRKTGILQLAVTGQVHVGTFTGYICAEGSEVGVFGFPITDIYDTIAKFRHGALLYRKNSDGLLQSNAVRDTNNLFLPWKPRIDRVDVKMNDTIRFMVNDKETENNFGHFTVRLNIE